MKNEVVNNSYFQKINTESLKPAVPGEVYYFKTTKSTNLEAKLATDVPNKSLFIAEAQEAGRGRLGRSWSSPSKTGIWMSIFLKPEIPAEEISKLTLLAGIAVSRAIPGASIKWPNDVIMSGKKICGILTESTVENGRVSGVIVGIGINVNNQEFPEELADKATSVYLETKHFSLRENIINEVLTEFFRIYDGFIAGGFEAFRDEYIKKCITIGREVIVIGSDREMTARAVDITSDGELVIETELGREIVNSGEVSVRGLLGYC